MNKVLNFFSFILIGLIFSGTMFTSCVKVTTRELAYFQSSDSLKYKLLSGLRPETSRIQAQDNLAIVISSMDQQTNEVLNFSNSTSVQSGGENAGSQPLGYTVDDLGNVELPLVGKVNLANLTLSEASQKIRHLIDSSLIVDPAVNIRFLNHKFTVLGEVGRNGSFSLTDDRTTLLQALASAGDIGLYGNRENVMILREAANGSKEMVRINLRTEEIFDSPYYYVKNGDLIYVEPLKEKTESVDQRSVRQPTIILSFVSVTIGLLAIILNATR